MIKLLIIACATLSVYAHVYQSNYGLANARYATDSVITSANVGSLREAWRFTPEGDVMGQATTATMNGTDVVYFCDTAGWLYCLNRPTGNLVWKTQISRATNIAGSFSRNAPAFYQNKIYVGDQKSARFMCFDATNGNLIWNTLLDPHPAAIVTQSPTVDNGMVLVGLSSTDTSVPNPTFQGSLSRLDANTGKVIWKFKTVPENNNQPGGYSGAGIWGSSPAIDYDRNSVYLSTGNNYGLPQSVIDCVRNPQVTDKMTCMDPNNHVDSMVSLNLDNGQVRWARNFVGVDYWSVVICPQQNSCGDYNVDFDFAQGPILFDIDGVAAVGCGNKGGMYYAVNRDTGDIIWSTRTGGGTAGGGMLHGSSSDANHIYVGNTNRWGNGWTFKNGQSCDGGYWSALNKKTGQIVWEFCNPTGARAFGPVTSANDLVFVGSIDPTGAIYALDANSGRMVWSSALGASVGGGAALTREWLIWGAGYAKWNIGTAGRRLSAFKVSDFEETTDAPTTTSAPSSVAPSTTVDPSSVEPSTTDASSTTVNPTSTVPSTTGSSTSTTTVAPTSTTTLAPGVTTTTSASSTTAAPTTAAPIDIPRSDAAKIISISGIIMVIIISVGL